MALWGKIIQDVHSFRCYSYLLSHVASNVVLCWVLSLALFELLMPISNELIRWGNTLNIEK